MSVRTITAGPASFGGGRLVLIAGPCVIESEDSVLRHAEKILEISQESGVPLVFKASYDKANRSSGKSFRGPGLAKGLKILAKVRKKLGIAVLSDIHCREEAGPAGEVLDILQIPAFLCRQTDLLQAAAKTGRIVNVKKGQFLSPAEMGNVVQKLESFGCRKILLTERGFSFGYQNLVSDFRGVPIMRRFGYPVIFDATHSVQMPGGQGDRSGGASEFIPVLSRCGVAAGADGIFLEVHENPAQALSDAANSLDVSRLRGLLEVLVRLKEAMAGAGEDE